MIEESGTTHNTEAEMDARTDSVEASHASISPKPIPNSAAAADRMVAPPVPLNPDDLHDLFAGAPSLEGHEDDDPLAQLRANPDYAALIQELEYIAAQARLLFAPGTEAPSDKVWDKIKLEMAATPEKAEID